MAYVQLKVVIHTKVIATCKLGRNRDLSLSPQITCPYFTRHVCSKYISCHKHTRVHDVPRTLCESPTVLFSNIRCSWHLRTRRKSSRKKSKVGEDGQAEPKKERKRSTRSVSPNDAKYTLAN